MDLGSKLKALGKEAAHPLIGFLPEQEWFEDHISWYNSEIGTASSGLLEILGGMGYAILCGNPKGLLLSMDGAFRKPNKGSYFLEIPWAIGKGVYNLPKCTDIDLDDINLGNSPWG